MFYSIVNLCPNRAQDMGGYGFTIKLWPSFRDAVAESHGASGARNISVYLATLAVWISTADWENRAVESNYCRTTSTVGARSN